jgi:hypothetical protein
VITRAWTCSSWNGRSFLGADHEVGSVAPQCGATWSCSRRASVPRRLLPRSLPSAPPAHQSGFAEHDCRHFQYSFACPPPPDRDSDTATTPASGGRPGKAARAEPMHGSCWLFSIVAAPMTKRKTDFADEDRAIARRALWLLKGNEPGRQQPPADIDIDLNRLMSFTGMTGFWCHSRASLWFGTRTRYALRRRRGRLWRRRISQTFASQKPASE